MAKVHLRKVNAANLPQCLQLKVKLEQQSLVAPVAKSLAEAYVNPNLYPMAIYDVAACGYEEPEIPVIGFTMYEIFTGVGFILRLMIDRQYQGQGYGKATTIEVIRRLKLYPEVEMIATSHLKGNERAASLYRGLGFKVWEIDWALSHPTEVYLKLEDSK